MAAPCTCLQPTAYARQLSARLRPRLGAPRVLDLFSGCGGLSLGLEAAGLGTHGYDCDPWAAATYLANLPRFTRGFLGPTTLLPDADVIVGGPPCQPFSVAGLQRGTSDDRNGFPAFLAVVKRLRPQLVIWENVPNLARHPALASLHKALRRYGYETGSRLLDASEFGVPQRRRRLFGCATRRGTSFAWPEPNGEAITAGDALGDAAWTCSHGQVLTQAQEAYVARYEKDSGCRQPRDIRPDQASRTLTCRNLAGATSDMARVLLQDGRRRRLTVREAARLQGFPDWFQFRGPESSQFRQIGNAVPPPIALAIGQAIAAAL